MSGKVASVGFSLSKLLLSWKLIAIGVDLLIKPQLLQNKIVLLQKVFLEKVFSMKRRSSSSGEDHVVVRLPPPQTAGRLQ